MAEPTQDYDFATDATYDADAAANKIAPPTILREEGWERGEEPGAQHLNYIVNALGQWMDWTRAMFAATEDLDATPSRTIAIAGAAFNTGDLTAGPRWVTSADPRGQLTSVADSARAYLDLRPYLPHGAVLTRVRVLATPGAARGSGFRVLVGLASFVPDFATPAAPSGAALFGSDDGGAATITAIDSGALSVTISSTTAYILEVVGGNDGGAHNNDVLWGVQLTFSDPGPRSF